MSGGNMTTKSSGPLDDIVEPIQNGLTEIRKKIRNLEKKKLKLDTLRDEVKKSGKPLNEDQSVSSLSKLKLFLQPAVLWSRFANLSRNA
jgi:hypothetical protein